MTTPMQPPPVPVALHRARERDAKIGRTTTGPELGLVPANAASSGDSAAGAPLPVEGVAAALPNLPDEFWRARPVLTHIRRAAHARCSSPDYVLHATLARLAAIQHHDTRVDTGTLTPAGLNFYSAAVGPSGAGKSTGFRVARDLLPVTWMGNADSFRDGVPLGSGEGLAELFMGTVMEESDEHVKSGPNKGERKKRQVRRQVRHNVLVFTDEGETLTRTLERSGATIGPVLRSAWVGAAIGQANGREDTTRIVPDGTYALGLVIGFQPETIGPLLADAAGGTPQRFLYASATDATIPDDPVDWPGALDDPTSVPVGPASTLDVVDADIRASVRANHLARHRGVGDAAPLDAHLPLHLAKTAALLAILDSRREVTAEDWGLAELLVRTSTEVRDALVERDRAEAQRRSDRRADEFVALRVRTEAEVRGVDARVERIARRLAEKVHADGAIGRSALYRKLPGRDRDLYASALDHAAGRGWVFADETTVRAADGRPA